MDKQRRRQLKEQGSRLVEENSARVRRELHKRNPFPVGHPGWVKNLRAEYQLNRRFRQNISQVLRSSELSDIAEIRKLNFVYKPDDRMIPRPGLYVQCLSCTDLVPVSCRVPLACSCGTISIDPASRSYLAPPDKHSVVHLLGKGPIRVMPEANPWWKFWR